MKPEFDKLFEPDFNTIEGCAQHIVVGIEDFNCDSIKCELLYLRYTYNALIQITDLKLNGIIIQISVTKHLYGIEVAVVDGIKARTYILKVKYTLNEVLYAVWSELLVRGHSLAPFCR